MNEQPYQRNAAGYLMLGSRHRLAARERRSKRQWDVPSWRLAQSPVYRRIPARLLVTGSGKRSPMSESGANGHPSESLPSHVARLYDSYGQRKPMRHPTPPTTEPHFFLLRTFLGENDLLVILNTKRCQYQCAFCRLPAKSTKSWVPDADVIAQFRYVTGEVRHALSIVDRVTLSNEGSVLDQQTLGAQALAEIVAGIGMMRRVRRIELETRLEFVQPDVLEELRQAAPRAQLAILTGFETVDERIRDEVLKKHEPLEAVLKGLDNVERAGAALTAYVLFKPDPQMSDHEACSEACRSIDFLARECNRRHIDLTIRLNPMYRAEDSLWARAADRVATYSPPRLTDVMKVAESAVAAHDGVRVYVGLSDEGLANAGGTYLARDDYNPGLIKYVKQFNDRQRSTFPWPEIDVDRPSSAGRHRAVSGALT